QGNEVGFKKIFKFGGFKFTMKKDKAAQPEPAHLLKVSRGGEEGAPSSDAAHQAPRSDEPDEQPAGATEPAQDASAGSGGAQGAEWSGGGGGEEEDIADLEIVDEEEVAEAIAAEAAASIAASVCKPPAEPLKEEAPVPPLKKMSGLFAGLRKKAGDKQKREEGAARAAAEDASRRPDDTRAEVEGKMAELARALEAHARGEEQAPDDQQPCSSKSEATPDVLVSMAHVLEAATCEEASSDPPAGQQQQQQKLAAANGESALETADKSKGTNEAAADDDHEGDATDNSARAKARTHEGPLKKFFKGSGLKKLPSLKRKVTKEREESEHLTGDEGESGTDGKRAQTSISVEDNNPGSPAHAKEAETKSEDSPHPGAAAVVADGRNVGAVRKREGITVWSSFKKLVTPKKRVKKAAESDTDDDPEDQADERSKSGAPAAAGRSQEARGETEEATAAADVAVEDASSEAALETAALTVAASDEARTDEDVAARGTAPAASDAEVTDGPEAAAAAAAGEEERRDESKLAAGSPEGTETTAGSGGRAEGAAKQGDEGRAGDSPKRESAWESFKRLVTPKKKAKAKGDNQQTESPKRECAKAENPSAAGWSIKKLFPGMRRRKADADAEGAEAEAAASPASGRVKCAEVHQDTPSVVPLSEFES
uniref:A kinase-anchoring proteins AKAP-5 and AKAP-12 calmodulin (CaM)-binding domain-containing protein n=1 Tax=Petromyzon marinus TaxID=7757 RepID=S4RQV2_PETMA